MKLLIPNYFNRDALVLHLPKSILGRKLYLNMFEIKQTQLKCILCIQK